VTQTNHQKAIKDKDVNVGYWLVYFTQQTAQHSGHGKQVAQRRTAVRETYRIQLDSGQLILSRQTP